MVGIVVANDLVTSEAKVSVAMVPVLSSRNIEGTFQYKDVV